MDEITIIKALRFLRVTNPHSRAVFFARDIQQVLNQQFNINPAYLDKLHNILEHLRNQAIVECNQIGHGYFGKLTNDFN